MDHQCEAYDCRKLTRDDELMCLRHWRMVPPVLARKVYATWKQRLASGNPTLHEAAKKAAIEAVAKAEGKTIPHA